MAKNNPQFGTWLTLYSMLSLIRIAVEDDHLLYKYWDLHSVNSPNKNSLSLMRSNLIGRTIFLPGEKYRMTNQKPDTIFFTSEKILIGFSPFRGGHAK